MLADGQGDALVLHAVDGEHADARLRVIVCVAALDGPYERLRWIQLGVH